MSAPPLRQARLQGMTKAKLINDYKLLPRADGRVLKKDELVNLAVGKVMHEENAKLIKKMKKEKEHREVRVVQRI